MSRPEHSVFLMTLHANFPVPVEVTSADQRDFHDLLARICERYETSHPGRVMWVGGWGAMPGQGEDTRLTADIMEREANPKKVCERAPVKCKYCDNPATKTLVWLKDKQQRPARIKLPWCGCDLMTSLRRIWAVPYQVVEGRDYVVEPTEAET